jgi:hypothetical protein
MKNYITFYVVTVKHENKEEKELTKPLKLIYAEEELKKYKKIYAGAQYTVKLKTIIKEC